MRSRAAAGATQPPPEALAAVEAAAFLGVKTATLYAYVSRGLIGAVPAADGRSRRYLRRDLERLRGRAAAPGRKPSAGPALAGPASGAAGALRWGEPVLDSALTAIADAGPRYRGHLALDLARGGTPFESVAELLWTGELPGERPAWRVRGGGLPGAALAALVPPGTPPMASLALLVPALAARDPGRFDTSPAAVLPRAREVILRMSGGLGLGLGLAREAGSGRAAGVAATIAAALRARGGESAVGALDRALVLSADHELNPSAFAVRVAASTAAHIYACVSAGLAAWSGPRHGGSCDRIEALVAEARGPERAAAAIHERRRRGEAVPGFGHRLYPAGDPRTPPLLEVARALAPRDRAVRTIGALVEAVAGEGGPAPSIDTGLVAVSAALGFPPGIAGGLFAVGRAAGWVAHALEQYAQGFLLRPRARYVGR